MQQALRPMGMVRRCRDCAPSSPIDQGKEFGRLGVLPIAAPLSGVLRGLCHDGVTVSARQQLVEVEPRANTQSGRSSSMVGMTFFICSLCVGGGPARLSRTA